LADYEALRHQVLASPQPGLPAPADGFWLVRQGMAAWLRREAPKVAGATSAIPPTAATILVPQRQHELVQALVNLALGRYPTLIL
jgi:hypothetical protein